MTPPTTTRAMTAPELRELHDRKARALARRPALARGVGQACVHLSGGFVCEVHDEDQMTRLDLPESEGGTACAPDPGQLMRASLGGCLATGYRSWAARLGTPIDTVDIEIICEYDHRGHTGLEAQVPVGWQRITFHVIIVSPAPEEAVRLVVKTADRLSPMLANLSAAVLRSHRLTVLPSRPRDFVSIDDTTLSQRNRP